MKELIQLDFEAKKKRYPNIPEHCLPKLKVKQSANGLTQAIIKFLTLHGHFATRTSSAGRYLVKEKKWIPSTTRKGYPDITAIMNGRTLAIEVKIGKDKMSQAQQCVKEEIEASGGIYFIAKSFDEFERFYNDTNTKNTL
ncbi:MAG: VRR-NUC domain-containing protein [Cyclobacteriaceae bacterium]